MVTRRRFLSAAAAGAAMFARIPDVLAATYDLVVKGGIDISVFPGSYVSFHDVGLKDGGSAEPALTQHFADPIARRSVSAR